MITQPLYEAIKLFTRDHYIECRHMHEYKRYQSKLDHVLALVDEDLLIRLYTRDGIIIGNDYPLKSLRQYLASHSTSWYETVKRKPSEASLSQRVDKLEREVYNLKNRIY